MAFGVKRETRSWALTIALTKDEYDEVSAAAARMGMRMSRFGWYCLGRVMEGMSAAVGLEAVGLASSSPSSASTAASASAVGPEVIEAMMKLGVDASGRSPSGLTLAEQVAQYELALETDRRQEANEHWYMSDEEIDADEAYVAWVKLGPGVDWNVENGATEKDVAARKAELRSILDVITGRGFASTADVGGSDVDGGAAAKASGPEVSGGVSPAESGKLVHLSTRVSERSRERLDQAAAEKGMTISALHRKIIDDWVEGTVLHPQVADLLRASLPPEKPSVFTPKGPLTTAIGTTIWANSPSKPRTKAEKEEAFMQAAIAAITPEIRASLDAAIKPL